VSTAQQLFDQYAKSYDVALSDALAPSGESREYFAEGRAEWLRRCVENVSPKPKRILDFGCGDGSTTPILRRTLNAETATGVDVSAKSLEVARSLNPERAIHYKLISELQATPEFELAYCNGVFHHIAPNERADAAGVVFDALVPGGYFSFWENNSWNPATRYVISRCAFDEDAILLSPLEARRLLKNAGFEILRTDFRFIFPRFLKTLRRAEDWLCRLPLGAQYQVLCRKPL
jgi:SAM-dependent methyltransferase